MSDKHAQKGKVDKYLISKKKKDAAFKDVTIVIGFNLIIGSQRKNNCANHIFVDFFIEINVYSICKTLPSTSFSSCCVD